ncbi:MAG: hypothetical protein Fur0035_06720 [Anaerolineales bacterium]
MVQPLNTPEETPIQPDVTEPLWTVEDVALYLRLNPETVRQMARSGRIPSLKVGRAWRFRATQVKTWLGAQGLSSSSSLLPLE